MALPASDLTKKADGRTTMELGAVVSAKLILTGSPGNPCFLRRLAGCRGTGAAGAGPGTQASHVSRPQSPLGAPPPWSP